ncbi:hypothetical protein [Ralstonia sp.]|uniref:hypothetical protein n=1 Tax=Ralstonia sp. TaxID=54061 RepID=UPI0031E4212C
MATQAPEVEKRQEWTPLSGVQLANGLLDVILKLSALLLVLPALAILTYLWTIHRADLFMPAVASGPGLFALLEATFIVGSILLVSFVMPSWVASHIANTYENQERPPRGAARFVLLISLLSGLSFFLLGLLWDANWLTKLVGTILVLLIPALSFLLAWSGPRFCNTLTDTERIDRKRRLWQSLKRTGCICGSIVSAVSTVVIFASVLSLYGLGNGWQSWLAGAAIFPAALFPGVMYLARRSGGDSQIMALIASCVMLALIPLFLIMRGVSPMPLALLTMQAMSVVEKEPRTFELVATKQRDAYMAMGFRFFGDSDFFAATIRFQFGDIRLICVDPYNAAQHYPNALGTESGSKAKQAFMPQTGCMTPLKDEVRVVQPPVLQGPNR